MSRRRRFLDHDRRTLLLALAAGVPGLALAAFLMLRGEHSPRVVWTSLGMAGALWLLAAFAARDHVVRPLQTLANLLSALREEDFSFRARPGQHGGALGEVLTEVNLLADALRHQRLGALEATALLRKVMEEIDVAVFAFDGDERLRLVNRAGENLLLEPMERLLGQRAAELGLADALAGQSPRVLDATFRGASGRFEIHRGTFRQGGLPHRLLVVANVSRALRDEERQAWQRLIRVIGHELNNSLAPIKSIAGSLESLLAREPRPPDADADMARGLSVIGSRADSLSRFMEAYARLAKLPPPQLRATQIAALVARATQVETRVAVAVQPGPTVTLRVDPDQIEQLLINLLKNAAEAALETGGGVSVSWTAPRRSGGFLDVWVDDEGPGLANSANLFVPFFTTKPQGTGIGLLLCRQIAEAHGGALTLATRETGRGCRALLRLPR